MIDIHGVIVPLVTPIIRNNESEFIIDEESSNSLINELIEKRCGALFIFGYAGGCTKILEVERRQKHLEKVIKHVNKRIPVIVGVAHDDITKSAELAMHAEKVGADAFVLLLNQGNNSYSEKIAAVINETNNIPLFLYNNPHVGQKQTLNAAELEQMLNMYRGRIAGLKESSGDEKLFCSFIELQRKLSFSLFMGDAMKISWIIKNQKDLNFTLPGVVPVEANLPERLILYQELLKGSNSEDIEYLSIPQVIEHLISQNKVAPATLEFWNNG